MSSDDDGVHSLGRLDAYQKVVATADPAACITVHSCAGSGKSSTLAMRARVLCDAGVPTHRTISHPSPTLPHVRPSHTSLRYRRADAPHPSPHVLQPQLLRPHGQAGPRRARRFVPHAPRPRPGTAARLRSSASQRGCGRAARPACDHQGGTRAALAAPGEASLEDRAQAARELRQGQVDRPAAGPATLGHRSALL